MGKGRFQNPFMGGNMQDLLRQAQKMQQKLSEAQENLKKLVAEGSAGGGMVVATVNGEQELLKLKINPEVVDPEDVEMLEDLVVAAVNDARRKIQEKSQEELNKITGGINIPGLFN